MSSGVFPRRGGFTMIELLIAMAIAGVIGSSIYFVYSGQSRVFYAQESIARMQSELRFAMDTVRADVKRAGYLAAATTFQDNFWCGPAPNPPLTGIFYAQGNTTGSPDPTVGFVHNAGENVNVAPDSLRLLGAFNANNSFYTSAVTGNVVTISNDPVYSPGFPATDADYLRMFPTGALLRILDTSNRYQIQRITGQSFGSRTITLENVNRSTIQGCGPAGIGQGLLVNPVEYVRYRVIDSSGGGACGSSPVMVGRSTLVRESLAPDGTTVVNTLPIADYIVDFRAWFMVDTSALGTQPAIAPDLNPYDFVGNATAADVNANPRSVRSVGLFMAIRTPQEDPTFGFRQRQQVTVGGQTGLGPLTSFNLDADRSASCRVRTLSTEVQVRNFALQQRM
jgi:prepilin-type N-terminal cleavage/methylation domain-containing protein